MRHRWARRLIRLAALSLAFGLLANVIVATWLCSRSVSSAFILMEKWPPGTPATWPPSPSAYEHESEWLVRLRWESLAERPEDLYTVLPTFKDRTDIPRSWQFQRPSGKSLFDPDFGKANGDGADSKAVATARTAAVVLAELAVRPDFTALRIESGWPYRCLRGECWFESRVDPATGQWKSTFARNRGIISTRDSIASPYVSLYPGRPMIAGLLGNTVTFASAPIMLIAGFWMIRRRFFGEAGRCPECGYAVGWMTVCSECGRRGAAWTDRRMGRFRRRRKRRHQGKIVVTAIAGLTLIGCFGWISTGLLAEAKTKHYIVAVWSWTVMIGESTSEWKYPGKALYATSLPNEWIVRVRRTPESTQLILPLWPAAIPMVFLIVRPWWNWRILRAARDTEHALRSRGQVEAIQLVDTSSTT